MKKLVALFLVLTLAMGMCSAALAYDEYNAVLMPQLDDYCATSSTMTESSFNRAVTIALLMVEDAYATDYAHSFASSGYSYIYKYGSCVDAYIRLSNGSYLNLFYLPGVGRITSYGVKTGHTNSSDYTYWSVDNETVTTIISALANSSGD